MQNKEISFNFSNSYSCFLEQKKERPQFHCTLKAIDSSVDIAFFKRSLSLHYQHIYAAKKMEGWFYRIIFFSLGLLFAFLGMSILFKSINFSCALFFKDGILVKTTVNYLSFFLAGNCFFLGVKVDPKKEAIQYLSAKVEKEGISPSKQLQIEFNSIFARK